MHDKFMLSHYVRKDLEEVMTYLNEAGYPFHMSWFDPYFEFRFPHYGTVQVKDIQMEIRMGIEPWHVLGKKCRAAVRQDLSILPWNGYSVLLKNLHSDRYVLLCNGCRVPLSPTDIKGQYVCGIRYRAWQPPSALHPTIGIDSPLVFDIVDTWNNRS